MPKIPEFGVFTSDVAGAVTGRRATAADAGSAQGLLIAGQGIKSVGDAITRRATQSEISDLTAKMSEAQAQFTTQFQETFRTADPGDKTLTDNLMKGYDEHIAKIKEGVRTNGGELYFQRTSAAQRSHFIQTAVAGQTELAGVKTRQDYIKVRNNLSSSLIDDPSAFELSRQQHNAGLDSLIEQGLPSKVAAQLKTDGGTALVKASIRGWIKNTPEEIKKDLKDGKWNKFIDGDLKRQLMGEADQELRAGKVENERQRRESKRLKEEQQMVIQNDLLGKMNDKSLTKDDIMNSQLDPFGSGSKQQFLNMMNKEEAKVDPVTFNELFARINLPDGDPNKLLNENELNAFVGRGLDYQSINQLRNEIQGTRTIEGKRASDLKKSVMDEARRQLIKIDPITKQADPDGSTSFQAFTSFFLNEYDRLIREGKTPEQLTDPNSKDYLGKEIFKYKKTPMEIIRSRVRGFMQKSNAPAAVPKNEDESAADYLKRIGGE